MDDGGRLRLATAKLIDDASTPGDQWNACAELHDVLARAAGLEAEEYDPVFASEIVLPFGVAIAPVEAARCVTDFTRTRLFVMAVARAIEQRRRGRPDRPIHVLYAGCGPFATMLLAAFDRFTPDDFECTLLDVHQRSIDCVGRVIDRFGWSGHVRAVERADATTYRIPDDAAVDVIAVECLLRGLTREPQVAIAWNLVDQAGPDAVMVPEEIRLDLVHVDLQQLASVAQPDLVRCDDRPVFVLNAPTIRGWGPMAGQQVTPGASTCSLPGLPTDHHQYALATGIRVLGNLELADYDSGLTRVQLLDVPSHLRPVTQVEFVYELTSPGPAVRACPPSDRPA